MSKNNAIEINCRIRPIKSKSDKIKINEDSNKIEFVGMVDRIKDYWVNNSKDNYDFSFNHVFNEDAKQEEIFDHSAKDIIDNAFEGYNGTIFAYGQTGSGKTYTMTGGKTYKERGIIPRAISYVFDVIKQKTELKTNIIITYLEIYNNKGYDLLEKNDSNSLENLPKIIPQENKDNELILKNLKSHRVDDEEKALNLLFIGDLNRVVCDTPMNEVSTRSHCIFTITIETENINTGFSSIGKINLVDLSGSERIKKTQVTGKILEEACNINLSLFYLEQVIINLQERSKGKNVLIPYRHSLMTLLLRDSLGGNCITKMIFTVNPQENYNDESISTCYFAQRVALIKNIIKRNENLKPEYVIEKLKREIESLKSEIKMLKGDSFKEILEEKDITNIKTAVDNYIDNKSSSIVFSDRLMVEFAFNYFKSKIKSTKHEVTNNKEEDDSNLSHQISNLKTTIKEKDLEINLLLKKLKNMNKEFDDNINKNSDSNSAYTEEKDLEFPEYDKNLKNQIVSKHETKKEQQISIELIKANKLISIDLDFSKIDINDTENLKTIFLKYYKKKPAMEEDSKKFKKKNDKLKDLRTKIKSLQKDIEDLKNNLDEIRKKRAVQTIMNPTQDQTDTEEDNQILFKINKKSKETENLSKDFKSTISEIKWIHKILEKYKDDLKKDFEFWHSTINKHYGNNISINTKNSSKRELLNNFYKIKKQMNI